jgi:D-3-phosphoglycerate dehydrogenase
LVRPKVLLTDPITPRGVELLRAAVEIVLAPDNGADTLRRLVVDVDAIIVRVRLPNDLLDLGPRLLGAVRHGAGTDFIPVARATELGIVVANVPGVNAGAVAEWCIGQMIALARKLPQRDRWLRAGDWAAARAGAETTTELAGKTVGIIGMGAIGTRLSHACRVGLGMRVICTTRSRKPLPDGIASVALDTLAAESDFIVLACALTPETQHIVDARVLGLVKPTAFLVNAARGPLVDEAALVSALEARHLAGAALDVFENQPLAAGSPLLGRDDVVLSAHVAGQTAESSELLGVRAAEETLRILAGERPSSFVNAEVWDRRRRARDA